MWTAISEQELLNQEEEKEEGEVLGWLDFNTHNQGTFAEESRAAATFDATAASGDDGRGN